MIGDDHRIGARLHGQLGIFRLHDALDDQLAAPAVLDPFDVVPAQARIELAGGPFREGTQILGILHVAGDIAEGMAPGLEHAGTPAPLGGQIEHGRHGGARGHAQAVDQVLVALADDLQVSGEYQRGTLRCLGAIDQPPDIILVTHHVKLEPEGP